MGIEMLLTVLAAATLGNGLFDLIKSFLRGRFEAEKDKVRNSA